jgi:hypothetical protein
VDKPILSSDKAGLSINNNNNNDLQ